MFTYVSCLETDVKNSNKAEPLSRWGINLREMECFVKGKTRLQMCIWPGCAQPTTDPCLRETAIFKHNSALQYQESGLELRTGSYAETVPFIQNYQRTFVKLVKLFLNMHSLYRKNNLTFPLLLITTPLLRVCLHDNNVLKTDTFFQGFACR